MAAEQGEFQIVVLEAEADTYSHSLPCPCGKGLTSSMPSGTSSVTGGMAVAVRILPRANEREVDPRTLKVGER
jgi:hypothetical protein